MMSLEDPFYLNKLCNHASADLDQLVQMFQGSRYIAIIVVVIITFL